MGLRYRKSFKIAPGVKLNVSKKSIGISAGNKYGGISINSKTGTSARASVPGTGISYTTKIASNSKKTTPKEKPEQIITGQSHATPEETITSEQTNVSPKNKWVSFWLCLFVGVLGIHKFYEGKTVLGVVYLCTCGLFFIGVLIDLIVILCKPHYYY